MILFDLFGHAGNGNFLLKMLLNALALLAAAYFLKGVEIRNFVNAILIAVVLAFLNSTLGAFLGFISLPLRIITLGLFSLVVDAFVLMVTARFIKGFKLDGFSSAFWLAALLGIFNAILYQIYL